MCYPTSEPIKVPQKAAEVPLGDGLAQRAKLAIQTRKKNIDDAVNAAQ